MLADWQDFVTTGKLPGGTLPSGTLTGDVIDMMSARRNARRKAG
jgi:hypothetical protein